MQKTDQVLSKETKSATTKFVYFFGGGKAEGNSKMKEVLGGKGANLAEMTNLTIPVPPGFTISTQACQAYYEKSRQFPEGLRKEVEKSLHQLENLMGKKLGDPVDPLLVSVRSGAAVSMPGMMDTILNLGLNFQSVNGLATKTGNERFAWDSYRRFIQMFGDVVLEVERHLFEEALTQAREKKGVHFDNELDAIDLNELVIRYKRIVREAKGIDFPESPIEQLWLSIGAVFGSWNNARAIKYRQLNEIRGLFGTAVNVQSMVFGNMGPTSGTGVAFTRNPSTGENKLYGEFLMNAQGEDVVAGIRTPVPLAELKKVMPAVYDQFTQISKTLENHYRDMQDIEFTIQEGKLYLLQTRSGKRTAHAAVRVAVEMEKEKLIDRKTAILRVNPAQLDQLLHPTINPKAKYQVLTKGLPASPGAAVGQIVFYAQKAEEWDEQGHKVILVRAETSPEDIGGMAVAQGILTSRGGMTSHAAVVARGMGKCCVAGCQDTVVDEVKGTLTIGKRVLKEGDKITLNGSTGEVILGTVDLVSPELSGEFGELMKWADETRRLKVRTNADTPNDCKVARKFGAEGIGLCRTEHMFFEGDRIDAVREMILAEDHGGREKALEKILPMQKGDFVGIFEAMEGLPVTIRLLDPPLHEFVPHTEEEIQLLAKKINVSPDQLRAKSDSLKEFNPMLGHRGCRLGISFPEIYKMQTRAIFEAACEIAKRGIKVVPEVMIPLIGDVSELKVLKIDLEEVAKEVMGKAKIKVEYLFGTMIEIPRAALTADKIAAEAQFFSFGTNDLTQMTFGFSRDDAGVFLKDYLEKGILQDDPFQILDQEGVGRLIQIGIEKGRSVNPKLKVGICGEHGGNPPSIEFCHIQGMDYVSCSPYRVPVARLAAAHAQLKNA
ncbi:MAG: pyruvate, phosphate dikinase [Chlamydiae bacterium]|nr:pyruvate, phosphate dikinase [Chlamydiota bacterium]MBI3276817.1 pyruvate, phosphate dikinase [Chlamydiota bacterium]